MAKNKTRPATTPAAQTVEDLRAEYDRLADEAAGFEKETRDAIKRYDEELKAYRKGRAVEKAELMAAKLKAFRAWEAAKSAAATAPTPPPATEPPAEPALAEEAAPDAAPASA